MNPNLLLLPSVELTERVYHYLSRWKDYYSFSMVNTHMSKIAFNQISDLVFNIHEEKDITAHLSSKTARIVQVNNSVKITHGFIYLLLKNYAKCKMIKLEINHQMNIQTAEKMCKPLVKNGISLRIENSPQESMLNGLMETYHKKYSSQYIRYAENIGHPIKKQRILDTELMEVPKDPTKNHIFFLEKVLELAKNNFNTSNNNNEGIPNGFKKVIGKAVEYEPVNNLGLTSSNQLLAIDNSIVKDVRVVEQCLLMTDIEINDCNQCE